MNIIVCLHAPSPDPGGAGALGRDDANALRLALTLAARGPSHRVTALLAGTAVEEGPLRRALAAGADRAVRLTGEDYASADFHTLGQVLGGGLRRLGPDLVLAGARSDDEGVGAVPAAAARQLGFVYVSGVEEILSADGDATGGGAVEVVVRGGGRKRRLRVALPALLSVTGTSGAVATPPDRASNPSEVEVLSLVDPESTVVRRRTDLLGRAEPATRGTETVTTSESFIKSLTR